MNAIISKQKDKKLMMKFYLIIFGFCLLNFSCQKSTEKIPVKYFEFSYQNTFETAFSLKLGTGDSIYIREHWSRNDIYDSIESPKSKTNYVAKLDHEQFKTLVSYISKLKLKKYNDEYLEDYADGSSYVLFIDKDSVKKTISVHSYKDVPKELDSLAFWLYRLKKGLKLKKINRWLEFKTSGYVIPPPPPPAPTFKSSTLK